jgi:hypothetical protein
LGGFYALIASSDASSAGILTKHPNVTSTGYLGNVFNTDGGMRNGRGFKRRRGERVPFKTLLVQRAQHAADLVR